VAVLNVYDSTPALAAGVVGLLTTQGGSVDDFVAFALGTNATLPFTDSFNAGNPGNQLASTWTQRAGAFDLTANTARATATGANTATLNGISAADVTLTAVVQPQVGLPTGLGLVARHSGPGDTNMYWGALNVFGGNYLAQIWKNVNGAWSVVNLNSVQITVANAVGKTLRFEVVGTSLKLYLDDTLISFAHDASITAGSVGLRSSAGAAVDSFTADLVTANAPTLPFMDAFAANPPRNTLATDWQERSGTFSVASGRATGLAGAVPNVAALRGVNAADVTIAADFLFTAAGQSAQLVGRYQGNAAGIGDANMYLATVNTLANGNALLRILSYVNGTVTVLATATEVGYFASGFNTPVTGFLFQLLGTQLTLTFGATTLMATDATYASGSVGIRTTANAAVDNFNVTSP